MIARLLAILLLALPFGARAADAFDEVARAAGFQGRILATRGERTLVDRSYGTLRPDGPAPVASDAIWPLASVTKQMVATVAMQLIEEGRIALDDSVARHLPAFAGPTAADIRIVDLMGHRSGLPDPDSVPEPFTAGAAGNADLATGFCAGPPRDRPRASFRYQNCDYLVLGALLEAVTGQPWDRLVADRLARPLGLRSLTAFLPGVAPPAGLVPGFVGSKPGMMLDFWSYRAAGALHADLHDLWRFDRALMRGQLLPPASMERMWLGDPASGFAALGQWAFDAPLRGCAKPVRIIERRGALGGVGLRNFILPDENIVLIVATNRAETEFGEVWQGRGLSHDLLVAAACRSGA